MLSVNWQVPVRRRKIDPNRVSASVWIRAAQLFPYLSELGVKCLVNEKRKLTDVGVFVRRQDAEAQDLARDFRRRGVKVVFDLCVNYYDAPRWYAGGYGSNAQNRADCLRMTELSDVVVCASRSIADRASEFHSWVEYLPDSFDSRHFNRRKDPHDFERSKLRAAFSGVGKKVSELGPIVPVLVENKIALTVISDEAPRLEMPYEFLRWRYENFPAHILRGDFCIAHRILDSAYNRGHSFFKIGVFMTQGVPAIASPVPSYRELIAEERGGAICSTVEDWDKVIRSIVDDRTRLAKWSRDALGQTSTFATEIVARRYRDLFGKLSGKVGKGGIY